MGKINHVRIRHRIARSVLQRLIYFDIFSYPLTLSEIVKYCSYPDLEEHEGLKVLQELVNKKIVNYNNGFYYLKDEASKISLRLKDNELAARRMKTAKRFAALIANFPFVRAVFISGSLSKNVMKPDSDIDFFIITEPGRLWLCRGLLTIFKKVFLANSRRNFCINYLIDTNSLEIPDKNVYTATEIAFLLPMYNYSLYKDFMLSNDWYRKEYPNLNLHEENIKIVPVGFKNYLELLMKNNLGSWLDEKFFSVISRYWRKKFHWLDKESFAFNFRSLKNVSKHHPYSFQNIVLSRYYNNSVVFEMSMETALDNDVQLTDENSE